ncbi:hypothetical protein N7522_004052 [Penicillium canescens]|nr:hypothetical protein N7522_004052 [Penicillium canescens]
MIITRGWSDVSDELGSEANPIVINDDDSYGEQNTPEQHNSARSTEYFCTPEYRARLRDRGFPVLYDEPAVTDSNFDLASSRLIYGQSRDCICTPDSIPYIHLEEERSEVAKSAEGEERASQDKDESCYCMAEGHMSSCGELYQSWSRQGDKMEPSIQTSQPKNDDPPCQHGSGGRKRGHGGEDYSGNRRSKRLANQRKNDWVGGVFIL